MTPGSHLTPLSQFLHTCVWPWEPNMGMNRRALQEAANCINAGDSRSHWKWRVLWETSGLDFSEVGRQSAGYLESPPERPTSEPACFSSPDPSCCGEGTCLAPLPLETEGGGMGHLPGV